jgi:hypothetical protein
MRKIIFVALFLFFYSPFLIFSDTIFLKDGARLDVNNVKLDGEKYFYEMFGEIYSVDKEKVNRVELGEVPETPKNIEMEEPVNEKRHHDTEQNTYSINEISYKQFSTEKTSYKQVGEIEDFSYGKVGRYSIRIIVPLGRTKDEVRATLEKAVVGLKEKKRNAKAIMVFAYRPDDNPHSTFSVGRATIAPNGEWGKSATSDPMKITIELGELYFSNAATSINEGNNVNLKDPKGGTISLSREFGNWGDDYIIAIVPSNTPAVILERRAEAVGGSYELVRYKVKIMQGGFSKEGWVFKNAIEGEE